MSFLLAFGSHSREGIGSVWAWVLVGIGGYWGGIGTDCDIVLRHEAGRHIIPAWVLKQFAKLCNYGNINFEGIGVGEVNAI